MQPVKGRDAVAGDEGHIAAQHHDGVGSRRHRGHGHLHGVAGPQLGLLDHEAEPLHLFCGQGADDFLRLIAHHHQDIGDPYRFESVEKIGDHGPPQDLVEDLGMA